MLSNAAETPFTARLLCKHTAEMHVHDSTDPTRIVPSDARDSTSFICAYLSLSALDMLNVVE